MKRTLASALLLAISILITACGHWKQRLDPGEFSVPSTCPDFTGAYEFPGTEKASEICEFGRDETGEIKDLRALMLPTFDTTDLGGGYVRLIHPTRLTLRQDGCQSLEFGADRSRPIPLPERPPDLNLLEPEAYETVWSQWSLNLVPQIEGTEVSWAEESLRFSTRFIASGFGAGWGIERMRFGLEWADDGSLVVEYRHEQGSSGRDYRSSRCKLPRVD